MKIVAAYLLAVLGGNSNPSADHIKAILASGMRIIRMNLLCVLLNEINKNC